VPRQRRQRILSDRRYSGRVDPVCLTNRSSPRAAVALCMVSPHLHEAHMALHLRMAHKASCMDPGRRLKAFERQKGNFPAFCLK
jgi:hypothetical protein